MDRSDKEGKGGRGLQNKRVSEVVNDDFALDCFGPGMDESTTSPFSVREREDQAAGSDRTMEKNRKLNLGKP